MRPYWRGALALLLFASLGLALWFGLYRILVNGPETERQGVSPTAAATETSARSQTTFDRLSRSTVPAADPFDLAMRLRGRESSGQQPNPTPSSPQQVGARSRFRVLDLATSSSYEVDATLRYAGTMANFWVEDGIDVPESALLESARVFEGSIYPTVTTEFGAIPQTAAHVSPPVTVLNLRLKGADGYFWSADLYPSSVIPFSNERAMFYMAAGRGEVGSEAYNSTLAHEMQHMILWQADSNEESWVSEGLSELAELLCGYSKANRVSTFARHTDTGLNQMPADTATASQHYSAAFLFSSYYWQRFGSDAVRRLVATEADGIAGYDSVLGALSTGLVFEDLFADWVVANYVDDRVGVTQPWSYTALDVSVVPQTRISSYPARIDGTVTAFGTDYVVLEGEGNGVRLGFSAKEEARLVPTSAHSGVHFWWSNRGDNSDMTLTRTFDLTGLGEAHLQVSLWYDIEDGWDYAYIEASVDGGQTWQVLTGTHTTMGNPTGQSYGPGFTGRSGSDGSSAAVWLEESVDLSNYAGEVILLRFEYVTDIAANQPGLCIDDIRIPELGYSHDAEHDDDQWVGRGFVRIDNVIPRRYLVQTFAASEGDLELMRYWIERGRETELTVVTPAVVSISDISRFVDSSASYELVVEARP